MAEIIDVSFSCDKYAASLRAAGVKTVIRYYTRDSPSNSPKRLAHPEALALAAAGLKLCIVYEGLRGNQIANFDQATGLKDATHARTYAHHVIGQPGGSGIYFAVDTDASAGAIRDNVVPYFQGVAQAFSDQTGEPSYAIGVYGSGAVCQALLDAGLATLAWLAQSTGWADYRSFLGSSRWTMLQKMDALVAGVACDPNVARDGVDIGDFVLGTPKTLTAPVRMVNARSGLRLRAGPGVEFDVVSLLPYGTLVFPLRGIGAWTQVDLQGDAVADGYVSTGFLADVSGISPALANARDVASRPPV